MSAKSWNTWHLYIKILYLRTIHLNPLGVWKTECGAEHRPKEVYLNRDELHLLLFALRNTHISLLSLSASKTPSFAIESTSLTLDLSMIQFGIHHQISITFTRKSVMLRRCTLQVAPDHMLLPKSWWCKISSFKSLTMTFHYINIKCIIPYSWSDVSYNISLGLSYRLHHYYSNLILLYPSNELANPRRSDLFVPVVAPQPTFHQTLLTTLPGAHWEAIDQLRH